MKPEDSLQIIVSLKASSLVRPGGFEDGQSGKQPSESDTRKAEKTSVPPKCFLSFLYQCLVSITLPLILLALDNLLQPLITHTKS